MATKSAQGDPQSAEVIEEMLDTLDTTLDRVKVLYEQYFLGIQKQPPTYIHSDVERKLRDLTQLQIRNTGLRYRFATLQQKFGSYNSYWRRTVRQIENGTYARNLSKIGRQSAKSGQEIPEEILAAMPKRMREQVKRDREAAVALQRLRDKDKAPAGTTDELLTLEDVNLEDEEVAAFINEPSELRRSLRTSGGVHILKEDAEFDLDAYFQEVANETPKPAPAPVPPPEPAAPAGVRAAAIGTGRKSSPSIAPMMPPRPIGTGAIPHVPRPAPTPPRPAPPAPTTASAPPATAQPPTPPASAAPATAPIPTVPRPVVPAPPRPPIPSQVTRPIPFIPAQRPAPGAPSQVTRPIPVVPGSSTARPAVAVESMAGPFPRAKPEPAPKVEPAPKPAAPPVGKTGPQMPRPATPSPEPAMRPPPGMSDADVNALYAKYVKAKEMVGENAGPGSYGKLLKTINAQAPKIMEQYKAKGVDFSVVVKDNQVIIKAKPKT